MKKSLSALFIAAVFTVLFFSQRAGALSGEPIVSASAGRESAYVGDIIGFNVRAELPSGAYIAVNNNIIFNNFDVKQARVEHISENPNIYDVTFDLAAYKTGFLDIESVGITYIDSSGKKKMFFTPASGVMVNSVLGGGGKDIKDIKPLKKASMKLSCAAGAVLLIAVIIAFAVFAVKDIFKAENKKAVAADPKSEALANLDNLLKSGITKEGDTRIFYYRIAEILRTYISKRYDFNAMEMTSTELIKKFEEFREISIPRKDLRQYLIIFDLARYAGFKASEKDMLESFEKTKEFIGKL
jgi:hypothetical protein